MNIKLAIEGGLDENAEGYGTQRALLALFEDCLNLQQRKASTYGEAYRSQGYMGNVGRVLSKASRLKKMLWQDFDKQLESTEESVLDTLHDLINISAFAIINYAQRNKWGND